MPLPALAGSLKKHVCPLTLLLPVSHPAHLRGGQSAGQGGTGRMVYDTPQERTAMPAAALSASALKRPSLFLEQTRASIRTHAGLNRGQTCG